MIPATTTGSSITAARIPANLVLTDTGEPSSQAGGHRPKLIVSRVSRPASGPNGVTDASACDVANTPVADKRARRAAARERRRSVPAGTGEQLRDQVLSLPEVAAASTVTAYVARPGEPDTAPLLAALAGRGVRVLQPVLRPDFDLDWAEDDGTRATSGVHASLSEPTGHRLGPEAVREADVLLVPALTVDRAGVRLGNGKGCYDRALARVGRSVAGRGPPARRRGERRAAAGRGARPSGRRGRHALRRTPAQGWSVSLLAAAWLTAFVVNGQG